MSKLNGQTGTWAFSGDGGSEQVAANQTVRFGDVVALRRTSNAVPATPSAGAGGGSTPPAVPAAEQAKTTPSSVVSKSLKASAKKRVVTVSLKCAKENRLCQGSVYLVYKKRTLARRAFLIGGGKTTKLNVKLSKSAMKKLGKTKKKVKVNVFSRDAAGVASNSRQHGDADPDEVAGGAGRSRLAAATAEQPPDPRPQRGEEQRQPVDRLGRL